MSKNPGLIWFEGFISTTPCECGGLYTPVYTYTYRNETLKPLQTPSNPFPWNKNMNFEELLVAWNNAFNKRPVLAATLHWQASNGNDELARALGHPIPSAKSIGRLLAARAGKEIKGLHLVRCPGRSGNSTIWRIERVVPATPSITKARDNIEISEGVQRNG